MACTNDTPEEHEPRDHHATQQQSDARSCIDPDTAPDDGLSHDLFSLLMNGVHGIKKSLIAAANTSHSTAWF